jgi:predicted RNA binding protein YcfA (HicA-like mRNA interferase family)
VVADFYATIRLPIKVHDILHCQTGGNAMTKKEKLFKKALAGSKNIRFADLVALLEWFGFTQERITGSHHIFSHPKVPQAVSIQPDGNGQAKPYQVQQFLKLIEKYHLQTSAKATQETDQVIATTQPEEPTSGDET